MHKALHFSLVHGQDSTSLLGFAAITQGSYIFNVLPARNVMLRNVFMKLWMQYTNIAGTCVKFPLKRTRDPRAE